MSYHSVILRAHIEELLRSADIDQRNDELSDLLDAYIAASRRELEHPEEPHRRRTFAESTALTTEHDIDALDLLTHLCKPEDPSARHDGCRLPRQPARTRA